MNTVNTIIYRLIFLVCLLFNSSCFGAIGNKSDIVLNGCTPADDIILSLLNIHTKTIIDFIKWDLTLHSFNKNTFELNIIFGESQPNTLGFKQGGQKKSYHGEYYILKDDKNDIYHFKSREFQSELTMIKLNENIFHLLSPQKKLMVGNGGWSYTLNCKYPFQNKYSMHYLASAANILKDTSLQVIYDGRTPCQDFAVENNLTVSQSCFKLKWKLILNRDSKSFEPSTYILKRTNSRETDISGKWTFIKGTSSDPNIFILQLDPDKPKETISLIVGDENVLFFLNKDKTLFVGNDNFSFTLNKRNK